MARRSVHLLRLTIVESHVEYDHTCAQIVVFIWHNDIHCSDQQNTISYIHVHIVYTVSLKIIHKLTVPSYKFMGPCMYMYIHL